MAMLSRRAAAAATATLSRTLSLVNPAKHTTARFSTTSPMNHQPPPWLMLPPTFDAANNMVHNFYVLGENQVMSVVKEEEEEEEEEDEDEDELFCWQDRNFKAMGSSPGWLVFLDTRTSHLFIADPIIAFHMKLPPIHTQVTSIALNSHPSLFNQGRAFATFGPDNRLAFCTPHGRHECKWAALGHGTGYASVVYSKERELFFCCTDSRLEAWDLRDPLSPTMLPMPISSFDKRNYPPGTEYNFLVVAEPSGDLFHVRRFVTVDSSGPLGYGGPHLGFYHGSPYRTLGFDIHRYDPDTGLFVYMDCSLDGLAFFVGCNNGLAIHTDQYPELKPDSIYYTAPPAWIHWSYGGHDVGIFDNRDKSFSPCFYPRDVQSKKMVSGPMWFRSKNISRRTFLVHNHDGTLTITPKLPK